MQYCFDVEAFKACFVMRENYVIVILKCHDDDIEHLCLLN